jgi:magnesium-transporting ATPase (P-type)
MLPQPRGPSLPWQLFDQIVHRAERAIRTPSAVPPETAVARRNGRKTRLPSAELVPGDIVLLAEGDRISADAHVIQSAGLKVDNSMLTGESEPICRDDQPLDRAPVDIVDANNLVFAGDIGDLGVGRRGGGGHRSASAPGRRL